MERGYLKKYFKAVISKRLSLVETEPRTSNQHEFNGTAQLRSVFGDSDHRFDTNFLYISDSEDNIKCTSASLTWYDARRNHPTRTEYRMYYPSSEVTKSAHEGDSLFICLKQDNTVLCVIAEKDSTVANQLYWLFDLKCRTDNNFTVNDKLETVNGGFEYAIRKILEAIGIEYESNTSSTLLDKLLEKFDGAFPKTVIFSEYARSLVPDVTPAADPDQTLIEWLNMEERLFYVYERHIIQNRIEHGFMLNGKTDVESFIKFSLSVQNRRKARAGLSLENHLCALLDANKINYAHGEYTEGKSKPDFIFPSIKLYLDQTYPADNLTMLGVKTTCKDRWRQVLTEADRIANKHILTLEAAISENQTDSMRKENVQLVLPSMVHSSYSPKQQQWIWSVARFIEFVRDKQSRYRNHVC